MSLTATLAGLVLEKDAESIPASAFEAAKKSILDTLGVTLAGARAPGLPETLEQMRVWGGQPEARVLIYGDRLPAPNAAFVNSAMAHALDYDSVNKPGSLHLMVALLPVCLAAGEKAGVSGKEWLTAIILGAEVACRIGICYRNALPKGDYERSGFLPTSVVGGFGCTAAACRLLGLSAAETVNAMGLFYAQAAGNRQALFDRTLTKRLQPAFAAQSVLWAVALAQRGITGPAHALEGRAGLFRIYRNAEPPDKEALLKAYGYFQIERDSIKRYPFCGQAFVNAAVYLGREHRFQRADIESVEVHGLAGGLTDGAFEVGSAPQVNAQFTSRYAVALGLLRGKAGLPEIADEQVRKDREVMDLAREVVSGPIKAGQRGVSVRTTTGKTYTCFRTDREAFGHETMTLADVREKFQHCAEYSGLCSAGKAERLWDTIAHIESAGGLKEMLDFWSFSPEPADS